MAGTKATVKEGEKTAVKAKDSAAGKSQAKASSKTTTKPQAKAQAKSSSFDVAGFCRDMKAEMKKVTWPTKDELIRNTIIVLVAVVFSAALIWVIDIVFSKLIRLLLGV